jgi:hypothetical protein
MSIDHELATLRALIDEGIAELDAGLGRDDAGGDDEGSAC